MFSRYDPALAPLRDLFLSIRHNALRPPTSPKEKARRHIVFLDNTSTSDSPVSTDHLTLQLTVTLPPLS
jgi:hypothetical protein